MDIVIWLALVAGIPIAYLVALGHQIFTGKKRSALLSLLIAAVVAATAAWATGQGRGEWAGLGYFLVPVQAALAGLLALGFSQSQNARAPARPILAWIALAFSLLIIVYNVARGMRRASYNRAVVTYGQDEFGHFNREKRLIEAGLDLNPGRREIWLDSVIRARLQDSVFLTVALRYDSISPGLLDTLALSPFHDVARGVIGHNRTRPQTLAKIYRAHSGSDNFVVPLAQYRHTPPDILREIYHRPDTPRAIDVSLASNPNTPRDVLVAIARSAQNPETIEALITNEVVDCALLSEVASYMAGKGKSIARDYNVARLNEVWPKVCSGREAPTTSALR